MRKGTKITGFLKDIDMPERHGLIAKTEKIIKQRPFWEVVLVLAVISVIFIVIALWID
ncbi:MAG: hypothetical protein MUO22_09190 [Sedimentisphaerales bacterium]|jgi:hypothetical protein|nr:hypothetical protein [Sedimentisphaerales bacterium]